MKNRILIILTLFISSVLFVFFSVSKPAENTKSAITQSTLYNNPVPPAGNDNLDKFYFGAINGEMDYNCYNCDPYTRLDYLKFNLWHQYLGGEYDHTTNRWYPTGPFDGGVPQDKTFNNEISTYASVINVRIDVLYSQLLIKSIIMRPKIEYLCYGQRSDYRCVDVNHLEDPLLWFYSFQSPGHIGQDEQDYTFLNGKYVRHCRPQNSTNQGSWVDNSGTVVSKLKSNDEQSKDFGNDTVKCSDQWQGDNQYNWIIKPKIRIDPVYANNPANWPNPVCRIDIYNQDGYNQNDTSLNRIKSIDIKVRNFKLNNDNQYDGSYLEKYNFITSDWNDTSTETISHRSWGNKWMWQARGNRTTEDNYNLADIRIHWYGYCDMWIDYVRVDNDVASDLLSTDPNNNMHRTYNGWIDSEVTQIGQHSTNGIYPILYFYMELAEFNNLPCMAYVNQRIQAASGYRLSLIENLTPDNITFHIPWSDIPTIWNVNFLNQEYVQKVKCTAIFSECYPLNACHTTNLGEQNFSFVPNTFDN